MYDEYFEEILGFEEFYKYEGERGYEEIFLAQFSNGWINYLGNSFYNNDENNNLSKEIIEVLYPIPNFLYDKVREKMDEKAIKEKINEIQKEIIKIHTDYPILTSILREKNASGIEVKAIELSKKNNKDKNKNKIIIEKINQYLN